MVDRRTQALFEARAAVIKAMAHATRLIIIDELARHDRCVQELTDIIGADASTVSRHLSILRAVGIVESEKKGLQVFYSLRVPCVMDFFKCVESVIKSNVVQQVQLLKSKD
ncbi:MAG: metalloregulator ArsR/SmtB family transcription factor [candidate division Zixibacteria bacterium]|nr:metalloregulator ArsR/SmtB family transcription factor [candidate division Zixibacteria bacterium]